MRRSIGLLMLGLILVAIGRASIGGELDALREQLEHFDVKQRLKAVAGLRALGGEAAARALSGALDDEDWEVQEEAVRALGALADPKSIGPVARLALEGELVRIRVAAATALRDAGVDGAFRSLVRAAIRARDDEDRRRALEAAPLLASAADFGVVKPMLREREPAVRAAAFAALGSVGGDEALAAAEKGLRDPEVEVRLGAIRALGALGRPEALTGLTDVVLKEADPLVLRHLVAAVGGMDPKAAAKYLAGRAAGEENAGRRSRIVELLSLLRTPAAGAHLLRFLPDAEPMIRAFAARGLGAAAYAPAGSALEPLVLEDPDPTVRLVALDALGGLLADPAERTRLLVKAATKGSEEVAVRACVLIREQGDAPAAGAIAPLIDAPGWRLPVAALVTLGRLATEAQHSAVAARASDKDWKIRAAVFHAMGALRSPSFLPALLEGLSDPDPIARECAHRSLKAISGVDLGVRGDAWRDWYERQGDDFAAPPEVPPPPVPAGPAKNPVARVDVLQRAGLFLVPGSWDRIGDTLTDLGVRWTEVRAQDFGKAPLDPERVLLLVGGNSVIRPPDIERLQWFVHAGGYVFSSDRALKDWIAPAFPGLLGERSAGQAPRLTRVEPAAAGHPLMNGVLDESPLAAWFVPFIAYPMVLLDPFRTEVLVESLQLLQASGSSSMVGTFRYGHGRVANVVVLFRMSQENFADATARNRMRFAVDGLGLTIGQVRKLEALGLFDTAGTDKLPRAIADDHATFRLIVNFAAEQLHRTGNR